MHDALSRPVGMFHGDAADFHAYIAYVVCGALIEAGGDEGLGVSGDAFAHHLRYRGAAGLELSRLRFTRVVKLYSEIHKLTPEPRYSRFFDQNADDFTALKNDVDGFIRGAVTELEIEARLHALIDEASRHDALHGLVDASYQDVLHKRERKFAE